MLGTRSAPVPKKLACLSVVCAERKFKKLPVQRYSFAGGTRGAVEVRHALQAL